MQQEIEQRIISVAKDEKIFSDILNRGIDSESFIVHSEVFDFIQKYFYKYNSIPSSAIISSTFPGFLYADDVQEAEVKYLCDELIKANIKRKAISIINSSSDSLVVDPYGTIDSLISNLSGIRKNVNYSKSFADADALQRYEKVVQNRKKAEKGVTVGIKTGIGLFDEQYIGWQPGNLIGIVGRLGSGKSSLAEYLACQSYLSGKRILFLSPEMSVEEINYRWDTFLGKMKGYTFLNSDLPLGNVDLKEYKKWLHEVSERKDWMTLDSASGKRFNLGNITALVNEFSPDLLVVDGVALIDAPGEQSWMKLMNVSYGLKSIAQNSKIVIIATSQANRSAKDDMPTVAQVAFGDAFMQSVDYAIMIQKDVNNELVRYITIPKRRTGKAINKPVQVKFDINQGIISI